MRLLNQLTLPVHAKERLLERYDKKFSKRQETEFCRQLGGKNTILLPEKRCVVYFDGTWFLIAQEKNGTVSTFLSREMIKPEEKTLLRNSIAYNEICRQNKNDPFEAGLTAYPMGYVSLPKRKVPLPPVPDDSELPKEIQYLEQLLEKLR